MDLSKLVKKYRYDNGNFVINVGRTAGESVNQNQVFKDLINIGVPYEELQEAIQALAKACQASKEKFDESLEIRNEILNRYKHLTEDFKLVINQNSKNTLFYRIKDNQATLLGSTVPGTTDLANIIQKTYYVEVANLFKELRETYPKKERENLKIEIASMALATSTLDSIYLRQPVIINKDIRPLTLSTDNELSINKLPYVKNDSPVLNKTLQELLNRVSDHERLCAILWLAFNGRKSPYVVYLWGFGGDGKSSFTSMLRRGVGSDAVASFDNASQFSASGMFNKALIVFSENENPRILQKSEVKQLTGDSLVSIEYKGEDRFSATLSGLLIVDSNVLPSIDGDNFELRRLRLFKFEAPKNIELMSKEQYEDLLLENFNDFVNYCRICYEKLGNNWLVPASPNQQADFESLKDQAAIVVSKELWAKMKRQGNIEIDPTSEISEQDFYKILHEIADLKQLKKNFTDSNLIKYLRINHGIERIGGKFKGLRIEEKTTPYFERFED